MSLEDKKLLEFCKSMNLTPTQVAELTESGVDVEKAKEGMEIFLKAAGMNFSMSGVGYNVVKVLNVVRNGEYGMFPQETGGFGSVGQRVTKSVPQQPSQCVDPIEEIQKSMQANYETMQRQAAQIEQLQNARGIRKSSDQEFPRNYEAEQTQQGDAPEDEGWGAEDSMEITHASAVKLAKSLGVEATLGKH